MLIQYFFFQISYSPHRIVPRANGFLKKVDNYGIFSYHKWCHPTKFSPGQFLKNKSCSWKWNFLKEWFFKIIWGSMPPDSPRFCRTPQIVNPASTTGYHLHICAIINSSNLKLIECIYCNFDRITFVWSKKDGCIVQVIEIK